MDLYPWVVFIHVVAFLLFFIMHGVSMAVAFRLRSERDPERVRALLDISRLALTPSFVVVTIGFVAGILVGFMGDWWGELWIWMSLGLFLVASFAMTPMAASRLRAVRAAAGQPPPGRPPQTPPVEDHAAMARLLEAWNPVPAAVIGMGTFVIILWLMFFKPF